MVDVSAKRSTAGQGGQVERSADTDRASGPPACTTTPCGVCGSPGGTAHPRGIRPGRTDVARFGYPAGTKACKSCYTKLAYQAARPRVAAPCSACGGLAGYKRPQDVLPMRYDGGRFGRPGALLCHACLRDDPAAWGMVYGGGRREEASWAPTVAEVRREARAILNEAARAMDELEDRRVAAFERGPVVAAVTPARGARRAVREFDSTIFGRKATR